MNKFTIVRALSIIISVSLLAACGKTPLTSSTQAPSGTYGDTSPTQKAAASSSDTTSTGACTILTQADVATALAVNVDSAVETGLGGVCTYTATDLTIDLTVFHTGGIKYVQDTFTKLGDLALTVPGLGDQAFINTNVNTLFVLKGDAAYLISVNDTGYKLSTEELQAKEELVGQQLISNLS